MEKPRPLMVLMPLASSGSMSYATHQFLEQLAFAYAELGVPYTELIGQGLDQPQARAELLACFRQSRDFEDALFIDGDMVGTPELVVELGKLEEALLVCPYEQRVPDPFKRTERGTAGWSVDNAGVEVMPVVREKRRMLPVRGAGIGFTRIRREVIESMTERFSGGPLEWTSHLPGTMGLRVVGLFEPIVHEHPDGSGVMRRRSEDMSFFWRAIEAGFQPYALCDSIVWHAGKGGRSLWDAMLEERRLREAMRRRVNFELVDCPDNLLGLHEVLDGAYDVPGLELEPGEVVLDVGANIGAFAVWAGKRWPGCRVRCYEPEPHNLERLRKNVTGAEVHPVAVVGPEKMERVMLYPGKLNDGEHSIHRIEGNHEETGISVEAMPARKLPPCAVLKVDTEGAEREILEAYPHLESCKALLLEWHSFEDYRWMRTKLVERGFIPIVDRAHGRPAPDRELCFIRRGVLKDAGKAAE